MNAEKSGWLEKKGTGLSKWKRWWACVRQGQLEVHSKEKSAAAGKEAKERWVLTGALLRHVDDHEGQFRIGVLHEGEDTLLRVDSEDERRAWCDAMVAHGAVRMRGETAADTGAARSGAGAGSSADDGLGSGTELPLVAGEVELYLPPANALGMASQLIGWIHRSPYGKRNWKRRFCVVMDAMLYTYKRDTDAKPDSAMLLTDWVVLASEEVECGKKFGFKLSRGGVRYLFHASSADEVTDWMAALRDAAALHLARNITSMTTHLQSAFDFSGSLEYSVDADAPASARKYRRRFFVLVGGQLLQYKSLRDAEPADVTPLSPYTVELDLDTERGFRLLSIDPDAARPYWFRAPSQDEQSLWLSVLHQASTGTAVSVPLTSAQKSALLTQRINAEVSNSTFFEEGTTIVQLTLVANCKYPTTNAELEAAVAAFNAQLSLPPEASADYYLAVNKPRLVHPSIRASIQERSHIDIAGSKPSALLANARDYGSSLASADVKRLRREKRLSSAPFSAHTATIAAATPPPSAASATAVDVAPPPPAAAAAAVVLPSPPDPSFLAASAVVDDLPGHL